jgi:hypothetical protein
LGARCHYCGGEVPEMFGLLLGAVSWRVLRAIADAGPDGIEKAELWRIIYGDRPIRNSSNLLTVHVSKLNTKLARVGRTIVLVGGRGRGRAARWALIPSENKIPAREGAVLDVGNY